MAEANLVQLAQAGDASAIAALMNASLQTIGVQARAVTRGDDLHVLLESERSLPPVTCIEFLRQGIAQLGVACLSSAFIYCRAIGQDAPNWVQRIDLSSLPLVANPFTLPPDEFLEENTFWLRFKPEFLEWNRGRLFDLMLLGIPILLVVNSIYIWNRYLTVTPTQMPSIAASSSASPAAPGADPFQAGYQHAVQAVKLTHAMRLEEREAWQIITEEWRQATTLMRSVPASHPKAAIAQRKAEEYQRYADYVASLMGMQLKKVISGGIAPRSIVAADGLFFAPNGSYNHTITIYDRSFNLVKTLSDSVSLAEFGYNQFSGKHQGDPIEGAAAPDGKAVWIANAQMSGDGFKQIADDACTPTSNYESSFLYRVSTETLQIDRVVQVGALPKSLATTPDNRYVLVSNWCSWDVSVVDTQTQREVRRIQVGPFPRGIAIDVKSAKAYIALFGGDDIAIMNLTDFSVRWLTNIGRAPHHLALDPSGKYLYATFSGTGEVVKIDLETQTIVARAATGNTPRSLAIANTGQHLYVVNYGSDTVSKIHTPTMQIAQTVEVKPSPIGVTYDAQTRQVWVASQSGSILVFQD
jgi:YVTN family beta-propeller protein